MWASRGDNSDKHDNNAIITEILQLRGELFLLLVQLPQPHEEQLRLPLQLLAARFQDLLGGLLRRLAQPLEQELERRDPAGPVALDLVAHRARQVVRAADDLVPVALAERRGDVEVEALGREHEHDRSVDLLRRDRRAFWLRPLRRWLGLLRLWLRR